MVGYGILSSFNNASLMIVENTWNHVENSETTTVYGSQRHNTLNETEMLIKYERESGLYDSQQFSYLPTSYNTIIDKRCNYYNYTDM